MRAMTIVLLTWRPATCSVALACALSAVVAIGDEAADAAISSAGDFKVLDRDGSSAVSLAEFLRDVRPADLSSRQWTFYERDLDADGWLSAEELANDDPAKVSVHVKEFRYYDVDGNCVLSRKEFVDPVKPKYEEAATLEFAIFDRDENGSLSFEEFCFTPRIDPGHESRFRRLDRDRNGKLTCVEFLTPCAPAQRATQRAVFYQWDADNDQQLTLEEFRKAGEGVVLSLKNKYLARDLNDDGRLSRDEYCRPFIGSQWDQAVRNEAEQSDGDGDGFLSLLEFSFTPQERFHGEELFALFDANGDGAVSVDEFVKPRPRPLWPAIGAAFYRADLDGDRRLSREEFVNQGQADHVRPDAVAQRIEQLVQGVEQACQSAAVGEGPAAITTEHWPRAQIERIAVDLTGITFREWDRERNGAITPAERRALVEIAFGARRTDGLALRKPAGYVLNWAYLRALDKNKDDVISREEFVAGYHEGAPDAARFAEWDKDGDGQLMPAEWTSLPWGFADVYSDFCRVDANLDGRVIRDEVIAAAAPWQKGMAARLVAAFDSDGDGGLDLDEFVLSPFANPVHDWYVPRRDTDNDGRLSWPEFYGGPSPFLCGLSRWFFTRFDHDGDGFLSRAEFEFSVDIEKAPGEAAVPALDRDGDGRLTVNELVEADRPKTDDPTVLLAWEEKTMRAEEAFRTADSDRDGAISAEEFDNQRAALSAAILGKAPPGIAARIAGGSGPVSADDAGRGNWRFPALVAGNVVLLVGVAWMFLRRGGRRAG